MLKTLAKDFKQAEKKRARYLSEGDKERAKAERVKMYDIALKAHSKGFTLQELFDQIDKEG